MSRGTFVSTVASAALALGFGATAAAETPLMAKHSRRCVDVSGASQSSGAEVVQWRCSGADNQQFDLKRRRSGVYQLVARHSGMCLDVAGGSLEDGAQVVQWPCHNGLNQQFLLGRLADGSYLLIAAHSGLCVDVANAGRFNGPDIIQYRCHGGDNQRFYLEGFFGDEPEDAVPIEAATD